MYHTYNGLGAACNLWFPVPRALTHRLKGLFQASRDANLRTMSLQDQTITRAPFLVIRNSRVADTKIDLSEYLGTVTPNAITKRLYTMEMALLRNIIPKNEFTV